MSYVGIAVIIAMCALFAFQWRIARQARKIEGQPAPALTPEVTTKLHEHGKVLIYFYSPNCGPCRAMTPRIDQAIASHDNIFKFDVSQSLDLARRLGVMATPTTVRIAGDHIERVNLGALSAAGIEQLLA